MVLSLSRVSDFRPNCMRCSLTPDPWWNRCPRLGPQHLGSWVSGVSCQPKVPCRGDGQKLALLRSGCRGDTPPLKGCCRVTFGYRGRTC